MKVCYNYYRKKVIVMKKAIIIILVIIVTLFLLFIVEECIRLKNNVDASPLFVISKSKCSKIDWICYDEEGKYTEVYWSFGFVLKEEYSLNIESTEALIKYNLDKKEFLLFNSIKLWNLTYGGG